MKLTEKQKKFLKEFRQVFTSKDYNADIDGDSIRIEHKKEKYSLFGARAIEIYHFVRCLKIAKEKGIITKINIKDTEEMGYMFSMLISITVYDGIHPTTILQNKYIQKYKLSDKIKKFFAEYINKNVINIRFGGQDGEGISYNTCDFTNIY